MQSYRWVLSCFPERHENEQHEEEGEEFIWPLWITVPLGIENCVDEYARYICGQLCSCETILIRMCFFQLYLSLWEMKKGKQALKVDCRVLKEERQKESEREKTCPEYSVFIALSSLPMHHHTRICHALFGHMSGRLSFLWKLVQRLTLISKKGNK